MIYGPSKRLTQNPNPRQYPPIAPTGGRGGWLTEAGLTEFENDVKWEAGAIDKSILTQVAIFDRLPTVIAMARSALAHQAAPETATDLPLGEVIAAWRAVKKCTDEFLPEYPGACEEYKSVLHEQLNALEGQP